MRKEVYRQVGRDRVSFQCLDEEQIVDEDEQQDHGCNQA